MEFEEPLSGRFLVLNYAQDEEHYVLILKGPGGKIRLAKMPIAIVRLVRNNHGLDEFKKEECFVLEIREIEDWRIPIFRSCTDKEKSEIIALPPGPTVR